MIDMVQLLTQLGIGVSANSLYDFLKTYFTNNPNPSNKELKTKLASFLHIKNADILAEKIVDFLAKNGDIAIEGTKIRANDSISMFSSQNTKFKFGNKSTSETKNTKIVAGDGASIEGQGGAGIKQDEDGSISFFT